ncbi:MAG: hypothetical protein ACLFV7_02065 [Phycisphaerae bacterium]
MSDEEPIDIPGPWTTLLSAEGPTPRGICAFEDLLGVWHLLADRNGGPGLVHATGRALPQPFTRNPDILPDVPSLAAPHVVHDGKAFCLFAADGERLLWTRSTDPNTWVDLPQEVCHVPAASADPYVILLRKVWYLFHPGRVEREGGATPAIQLRTSQNLRNWSQPKTVYAGEGGQEQPGLSLPALVRKGRTHVLIAREDADPPLTLAVVSRRPDRFAWRNRALAGAWSGADIIRPVAHGDYWYLLRVVTEEGGGWSAQISPLAVR